jgi:hypothetical protein
VTLRTDLSSANKRRFEEVNAELVGLKRAYVPKSEYTSLALKHEMAERENASYMRQQAQAAEQNHELARKLSALQTCLEEKEKENLELYMQQNPSFALGDSGDEMEPKSATLWA